MKAGGNQIHGNFPFLNERISFYSQELKGNDN